MPRNPTRSSLDVPRVRMKGLSAVDLYEWKVSPGQITYDVHYHDQGTGVKRFLAPEGLLNYLADLVIKRKKGEF